MLLRHRCRHILPLMISRPDIDTTTSPNSLLSLDWDLGIEPLKPRPPQSRAVPPNPRCAMLPHDSPPPQTTLHLHRQRAGAVSTFTTGSGIGRMMSRGQKMRWRAATGDSCRAVPFESETRACRLAGAQPDLWLAILSRSMPVAADQARPTFRTRSQRRRPPGSRSQHSAPGSR